MPPRPNLSIDDDQWRNDHHPVMPERPIPKSAKLVSERAR